MNLNIKMVKKQGDGYLLELELQQKDVNILYNVFIFNFLVVVDQMMNEVVALKLESGFTRMMAIIIGNKKF